MFYDSRELPDQSEFHGDVCVVGAGAAGLSIALELAKGGIQVCVIESGGLAYDSGTQALYHGENLGVPYFSLASTRLRFFGGTTNHWGGNCYPFSPLTFESLPWIRDSGWPISGADLEPFYTRAQGVLGLPDRPWDYDYWVGKAGMEAFPIDGKYFEPYVVQLHPTRFNIEYRDLVAASELIQVYLGANVTEIEQDRDTGDVSLLRIACLNGRRHSARASRFVLAAGGIENPRLLLLSDGVQANGIGNDQDLVGRYFMDQPRFVAGRLQPVDSHVVIWPHGRTTNLDDGRFSVQLRLREQAQRDNQLPRTNISLITVLDPDYERAKRARGTLSFRQLVKDASRSEWPDDLGTHLGNVLADFGDVSQYAYERYMRDGIPLERIDCSVRFEPIPNRDSRVVLSEKRDALGLRRADLDWQLHEDDKQSVRKTIELFALEAGRPGLGRVQSLVEDDDWAWPETMAGGHHHIGTTRMSNDARHGVVDGNCRVHGVRNLFIAGSSVFPTADVGWPTLTIVALAIRLAEQLKSEAA